MQFVEWKRLWDIEKEALINTSVHSNFNYGCLIWHFSSKKSQGKVKKNHKKGLKFLLNDYLSSYAELLDQSTSIGIKIDTKRSRTMVYEIFKALNNLNPVFMKDTFHYSPNCS